MRRKDREVKDRKEILEIIDECSTMHVAFGGDSSPYVVPLSFGYSDEGGALELYFHCAQAGMKLDCLKNSDRVCFECETFLGFEETAQGITTKYRSIIGFGSCSILKDEDGKVHAMRKILSHCGYPDYPVEECGALGHTTVCRITVDSVTGKRNAE